MDGAGYKWFQLRNVSRFRVVRVINDLGRKCFENSVNIMEFSFLEKYIDHLHTINGVPVRVTDNLKNEILENFNSLLVLKKQGTNLFFTDIDKIKKNMLDELK